MNLDLPTSTSEKMKHLSQSHGGEPNPESVYTAAEVARLFGVPESRLRYWSQTGFITPTGRVQQRRVYTFRDLIAVKVAKELLDAGLPLQRVRRSLDALRHQLPRVDMPFSRLRIRSDRERILVEDGDSTFEAATGQLLLDFDVAKLRDKVAEVLTLPWVRRGVGGESGGETAYEAFLRGQRHEAEWTSLGAEDPAYIAAKQAYERALELDPEFAAAWTNLGALAAKLGDHEAARDAFDQALTCDPEQAEAQCNLAELALREGDAELAIEGFRLALRTSPDYAEAHYGLARALLAVGGKGQALAHLERFRAALLGENSHLDFISASGPAEEDVANPRLAQVERVIVALREELDG